MEKKVPSSLGAAFSRMNVAIRPASIADIDRLVAIENSVFITDRLSRRSFRQAVESPTTETLVAARYERAGREEAIAGYCMVLFRRGSGVARLYSIAVDPAFGHSGIGRALLDAAEKTAFEKDRLLLRLEVREDNGAAITLYEKSGYYRIGREPEYYEDGAVALRFQKMLRGDVSVVTRVPYYEQSEEFTCGPACLMMAKASFDPAFVPDAVTEVRLWREATTIFMMSGPGGCEPFGLAVAAYENGVDAEIFVSFYGALFLQSVRSEEKRRVMELAQVDFRNRAERYRIPVEYRAFTIDDVRRALAQGKLVVVLVSGFLMFGKKVPHWVLAIGDDGNHIMLHDPWLEGERGETAADAANIPVPYSVFMAMAQFGKQGLRAAVVLGKREER